MAAATVSIPHAVSGEELLAGLGVESGRGLTLDEAQARLRSFGANALPEAKRKPLWRIFLKQFRSPLIYLLLVYANIQKLLLFLLRHLGR